MIRRSALTMLAAAALWSAGAFAAPGVNSEGWLLDQVEAGRSQGNPEIVRNALAKLAQIGSNPVGYQLELLRYELSEGNQPEVQAAMQELCRDEVSELCQRARALEKDFQSGRMRRYGEVSLLETAGRNEEAAELLKKIYGEEIQEPHAELHYAKLLMKIPGREQEGERILAKLARQPASGPLVRHESQKAAQSIRVESLAEHAIDNAYKDGEREKSIQTLKELVEAHSDHPDAEHWRKTIRQASYWAGLNKADDLYDKKQYADALKKYEEIRELLPDDPQATLGLANIAREKGDLAKSLELLNEARAKSANDADDIAHIDRKIAYVKSLQEKVRQEEEQVKAQEAPRPVIQIVAPEKPSVPMVAAATATKAIPIFSPAPQRQPAAEKPKPKETDPWDLYDVAKFYRAKGDNERAKKVFSRYSAKRFRDPDFAYAYALLLSSIGEEEKALSVLNGAVSLTAGMKAMRAKLEREVAMKKARKLADESKYEQALVQIQTLPSSESDVLYYRGRWYLAVGNVEKAQETYKELTKQDPDEAAKFSTAFIPKLLEAGKGEAAMQILSETKDFCRAYDVDDVIDIADSFDALGQTRNAAAVYGEFSKCPRSKVLKQDEDLGRLQRRNAMVLESLGENQAALDIYKQAMVSAGITTRLPADDEEFTELMRTPDEPEYDWLKRSVRARASDLYEKSNTTVTTSIVVTRDPGTDGYSNISSAVGIVEASTPFKGGVLTIRTDSVGITTGTLNVHGKWDKAFGYCFGGEPCDPSRALNKDFGQSVAIAWKGDRLHMDLGTTPIGFEYMDIVGSIGYTFDVPWGKADVTVYRRPKDASLLSFGGQRDPVTGKTWGGVRRLGVQASSSIAFDDISGLWWFANAELITGRNVPTNHSVQAMAGYYRRIIDRPNHRLTVGPSVMLWHFGKNLDGYTFGRGGYYSPQFYASAGLSLTDIGRTRNWSWELQLRAGVSYAKTSGAARFPGSNSGWVPTGPDEWHYPNGAISTALMNKSDSDNSIGPGLGIRGSFERRLSSHFVLGGFAEFQNSKGYSPFIGGLYLRYYLNPWKGDLPMAPRPLVPYSQW